MAHPPDETPPDDSPDNSPACKRCGQAIELAAVLPRFGERPTYKIFNCAACGLIDWIAEQISGDAE